MIHYVGRKTNVYLVQLGITGISNGHILAIRNKKYRTFF